MASSSAVSRFVGTKELLYCLGEHIHNRKLLFNLCLVNKSFNDIFSVYFYKELWFCDRNLSWLFSDSRLDLLLANKHLQHVKTLTFAIHDDPDRLYSIRHGPFVVALAEPEACVRFNEGVVTLLDKMPELESFSWLGYPLFTTTLSSLYQKCTKIKKLTITYPTNSDLMLGLKLGDDGTILPRPRRWERVNHLWEIPSLPPFRNLVRLHVHNIWGPRSQLWREMITTILVNSPELSDLGLSLSTSTRRRELDMSWHEDSKKLHPAHFLRELCKSYARAGGKPLNLQCLYLGHFMFVLRRSPSPKGLRPQFPEEHLNGGCLDSLANLSKLKDLTLDLAGDTAFDLVDGDDPNDGDPNDDDSVDDGFDNVGELWWQTAPGPLPKLEKLSVRRPTTWLARWAKGIVREGTPLKQLKINQASQRRLEYVEDSPLATSWSDLLQCQPQELLLHGHPSGVVNMDYVLAAGDSIRFLAMAGQEICDYLEPVVSQMPKLEAIWLMEPVDFYAQSHFDRELGVPREDQKAAWVRIVRRAAFLCPTLKCVRVASIAWRIRRTAAGILLRELDRTENESSELPELFQISLPYDFDSAHAAKYWVNNRRRDMDDLI